MNLKITRYISKTLILLILVVNGVASVGQSLPQLTSEQKRIYDSLSPAQQEQLKKQYLGERGNDYTPRRSAEAPEPDIVLLEPPSTKLPTAAVLKPNDTVILILSPTDGDSRDRRLIELKQSVDRKNPFDLDANGFLRLPEIESINLAGLTQEQAKIRLEADPELEGLNIDVHLLPVKDIANPELTAFGYDIFNQGIDRFSSSDTLPIPKNYTVGPGDEVIVQLFGNERSHNLLQVDRDGMLNMPEIGPFQVAGLSLESLRAEITTRVERQLIGTQVSVTLGELRSVRVFLVGEAKNPGAYVVSAFSTITNVLSHGGGIAKHGTLRNIKLKRGGRIIRNLDLYDLLLSGDASGDRRIADGDVIFIPPVGPQITVAGQVRRPAIYEMESSNSLSVKDAIELAGGSLPSAFLQGIRISRQSAQAGRDVLDVDLNASGRSLFLRDGDYVKVPGGVDRLDNAVTLSGHVMRPGIQQWREGLNILDVVPSPRDLKNGADTRYVLIKRQSVFGGPLEVLSVDLQKLWDSGGSQSALALSKRDEVIVFSMDESRTVYMDAIIEELRLRSGSGSPSKIVRASGMVKHPGTYPLETGMKISDLVRAAGGLTESAYAVNAEMRRYGNDEHGQRKSDLEIVSLNFIGKSDHDGDWLLKPFDSLNIKEISEWGDESYIEIAGEVTFPGTYTISRGERLSSVISRAGGLKGTAFAEGSVFTRESLKKREQEQLSSLASRLEGDLASIALSDPSQAESLSVGRSLLNQVQSATPTGRLVIDLEAVVFGIENKDVLLRDGDRLVVPEASQEITVVGEVQYPTSHMWQNGLNRDEYLFLSGGYTARADRNRVYVVRANGEIVVANKSKFFSKVSGHSVQPGDTIVVPYDTERVSPLVLWTSVTQVLYNLAIAVAAVNGL